MKYSILLASLITVFGLSACDRPTVVNVPAPVITVAGPAGPQGNPGIQGASGIQGVDGNQGATGAQGYEGARGQTGMQGNEGSKGDVGQTGGNTVLIVPTGKQ